MRIFLFFFRFWRSVEQLTYIWGQWMQNVAMGMEKKCWGIIQYVRVKYTPLE